MALSTKTKVIIFSGLAIAAGVIIYLKLKKKTDVQQATVEDNTTESKPMIVAADRMASAPKDVLKAPAGQFTTMGVRQRS